MSTIGVAIPTYNREDLLSKLVQTIPEQVKVSISDNGSFLSSEIFTERPATVVHKTDRVLGIFENWNNAVKYLDTDWICIPSDDDIFYPQAFEEFEQAIIQYPNANIIVFGHHVIDENESIISTWVPTEADFKSGEGYGIFRYGVMARMPAILFRRSSFLELGGFDEFYQLTAGDSDIIQRVLLSGSSVFIPKVTSAYRVWPGNLTSRRAATKEWMDEIVYWQNKIKKELCLKNYSEKKSNQITHEVIIRNLISGLEKLAIQNQGLLPALKFISVVKYPLGAHLKSHLRLAINLMKCLV